MPWRSKAQRKLFYAKQRRGEISPETVAKWEAHTPPGKLPEHVTKHAMWAACADELDKNAVFALRTARPMASAFRRVWTEPARAAVTQEALVGGLPKIAVDVIALERALQKVRGVNVVKAPTLKDVLTLFSRKTDSAVRAQSAMDVGKSMQALSGGAITVPRKGQIGRVLQHRYPLFGAFFKPKRLDVFAPPGVGGVITIPESTLPTYVLHRLSLGRLPTVLGKEEHRALGTFFRAHEGYERAVRPGLVFPRGSHMSPEVLLKEHNLLVGTTGPGAEGARKMMLQLRPGGETSAVERAVRGVMGKSFRYGQGQKIPKAVRKEIMRRFHEDPGKIWPRPLSERVSGRVQLAAAAGVKKILREPPQWLPGKLPMYLASLREKLRGVGATV